MKNYTEYACSDELMVRIKCKHYDGSSKNKYCRNLNIDRYCPYRNNEEIKCNAKGNVHMTSLYYPIFKNK